MRCGFTPREREVFAHGLGAARAERDIVFAGAALVGMTFDGEGVLRVAGQPLRLVVEGGARLRRQRRLSRISKNTRSPTLTTKSCWLPG